MTSFPRESHGLSQPEFVRPREREAAREIHTHTHTHRQRTDKAQTNAGIAAGVDWPSGRKAARGFCPRAGAREGWAL